MSDALTLFDVPPSLPAYQRHSPTSRDAAKALRKRAPKVREMVRLYVLSRGEKGATYKECMEALALCSGTICGRLNELKESGICVETATRRGKCAVVVERRFYNRGSVAA